MILFKSHMIEELLRRCLLIKGTKRYFVASHTAKGFVNFLSSNIRQMNIIVISCPSLTIKTKIFRQLIKNIREDITNLEILQNAHSEKYFDGIIVRERSIAIIGDHIMPDHVMADKVIKVTEVCETDQWEPINELLSQAYHYLALSLTAHENIEKYYIESMDFSQSNLLIDHVMLELFSNKNESTNVDGTVYQRLFDSNALMGEFNLVPKLLQSVRYRYFIQGGPGTGKSYFMKKILNLSLKYGYSVEQYMCSYDPESTDMIIIKELNVCMLDSSGPHEFSPLSSTDQIIDLYQTSRTFDAGVTYAREIKHLRQKQKDARMKGKQLLKNAGQLLCSIEKD